MKFVRKWMLQLTERQTILVPSYAQILTVQLQKGHPALWALIDDDIIGGEPREIEIFGTDTPIQEPNGLKYISTHQFPGGEAHVFERSKQ